MLSFHTIRLKKEVFTRMLTIRSFTDSLTGITIRAIGKEGADTGHNYFTVMSWMSDSRQIVLCTEINEQKTGVYVRVDTDTGASEVIRGRMGWGRALVSSDDKLYCYDGPHIYEHDLVTGESRTVCSLEPDSVVYGPLSITNDGTVMGIYWRKGEQWIIGTVETATGCVTEAVKPLFAEPYPIANHAMVNPENRHLVFFAHEGRTEHVPDRIYMVDTLSGETRNAFRQKRKETGELIEYVGHEMWAADGESLYFVKYPHSPLKPTGIYRVHKQGGDAEWINGDFPYWHVSLSPDGRWAVSDTIERTDTSKIVLINLADRTSRLLCELPMWREHPGHPHPSFSPDSQKVCFTFADENQRLWIGIIDI